MRFAVVGRPEGALSGAPKAGVFEPALALLLARDELVLDQVVRKSGRWARSGLRGRPFNELHELIGKKASRSIQVRPRGGRGRAA